MHGMPPPVTPAGVVTRPSPHSVDDTVARITHLVQAKGATVFAVIDQAAEAARVGQQLRPTTLIVFGDPRAGTPLMDAVPSVAIDLPLKLLVWEADDATVQVSYNSPEYLTGRHGVPPHLAAALHAVEAVAAAVTAP